MKKLLILFICVLIYLLVTKSAFTKNFFTQKINFSEKIIFPEVVPENLYNGSKWDKYRLGDIILNPADSFYYDTTHPWNILYHVNQYPGSIASEYIKLNKDGVFKNVELLNQIMSKMDKNISIPDTTLVLHIRVGDVICDKTLHVYNPTDTYAKVGNINWWENVVEYIKNNKITNVVILSGIHLKKCINESVDYIKDRAEFLKNTTGVNIEFRLGQPPDDDILYCKNAKHFISTGGGFGEILKLLGK